MVEGQPVAEQGARFAVGDGNPSPVVALLDSGAFRPVALTKLAIPAGYDLLGDHRMVQAPIVARHESAKRVAPMLTESSEIATEATELGQHGIVVGQRSSWQLMPCGCPEQHGVPAPLRVALGGKVAIPQPGDVQRHEREVL